jgi:two-component system LytT family response regulator
MRTFKTLIIDDEPQALRLLEKMLLDFPQVNILRTFANPNEALLYMRDNHIDLVLMDIQMPDKSGFDVVAEARDAGIDFHVIFITAFDEYAVEAIRASAFDYLTKPVRRADLEQSLVRLERKVAANSPLAGFDTLIQLVKQHRIKVPDRNGYNYYLPSDIIFIEADGNYSELILKNRRELVTLGIGTLEEMLDEYGFIRVSRSFLINKNYLVRLNHKNHTCRLICETQTFELQVSHDRMKAIGDLNL